MNSLAYVKAGTSTKECGRRVVFNWQVLLPIAALLLMLALNVLIPTHQRITPTEVPYFNNFIYICLGFFSLLAISTIFLSKFREYFLYWVKFFTFFICLINVFNLITAKTALLPLVYFPSSDHILRIFVVRGELLTKCVLYSMRLYGSGVFFGGLLGIITGIVIGWSKRLNYWIFPFIRFIGPIPSSVWIPMALLIFPSVFGASAFIIGLNMWFPTTILTSSGIQNVSKKYFEVASTLGANTLYQIFHIAIPASLPTVFVGLFQGITSSFMALLIAEMIGVKYGIGWFVNWQQQTMSFDSVYAGLILIALMCFIVLNILMYLRNKVLNWQEGAIRW